jgi:PAS domain S-box-containing protein
MTKSRIQIKPENSEEHENTVDSSESSYRGLFENVLEGIYRTSPQGKILTANPALISMLGYESAEEFYELDILHDLYVDPDQRKKVIDELEKEGAIKDAELVLKRKDGRHITVLESGRTVYDSKGEIAYYEGILTDITERKRAEKQLERLFKASKLLNSTISMEKIFKYISESVQELVGYDNFIIFLVSKDRKEIYPAYITKGLQEQLKDVVLEYGEGLVGYSIDTQEILLLDNADTDNRGKWVPGTEVCVSQILVPLIVEDKCVGVLHISKSIEEAYNQQDVDILKPLSEIISSAIRNSRLFEEVRAFGRELEKRINERSKKIEVLIHTRQDLQRERNWRKGLQIIIQSMRNLGFERCGVALVNPHRNTLEFQFGEGIDLPPKGTALSLKNTHYFGVKCVQEKKTIYVQDFKNREGKQITSDSQSFVWVPIIVQDEAFAALAADNIENNRPITEEDVKDLEILASMCASFIDRTRISIEPLVENNLETNSKFELNPTEGYILEEIKPIKSFEVFIDLVTHGIPGFVITREYPEKIMHKYNLVKTPIVWLSQSEKQNSVSPTDLSKLNYIIQEFVRKSEESVILFDGIEYLVAQIGFLPVLKFLHSLRDIIVTGNSRLILPVFKETLPPREFSMLLKEFTVVHVDDGSIFFSHN